jgi:chemotaxis protein methyltransferase CheR
MKGAASVQLVDRFAGLVAQRLGLHGDERLLPMLAELLRRRAGPQEAAQSAWLARLAELGTQAAPWLALGRELTITETSFLRYGEQFRAFAELAVPTCMERLPPGRPLRILSAGCASGDEAYSLAMCLFERWPQWVDRVTLLAVDINEAALEKARAARYGDWALRQLPLPWRERWFRRGPHGHTVSPALRAAVRFERRNLAAEDAQLWAANSWDIVFCRNVMMYFSPPQMASLVRRIERSLELGGFLFLGDAETLRGLGTGLRPRSSHGCFYYQRGPAAARPMLSAPWVQPAPLPPAGPVEKAPVSTPRPPRPTPAPVSKPSADLGPIFEAMREERFESVLQQLDGLPPSMAQSGAALLLRAASLAHTGAWREAEQVCLQMLRETNEQAGAHHVLALCREAAGRTAEAMAQDRVAIGLDPAFAMPRLHLGLMARRRGERALARRELTSAMTLLEQEEPTRLLLFGGGFERQALIALCRAELAQGPHTERT